MKKLIAAVMVLIMIVTAVPSFAEDSNVDEAAIEAAKKEVEECQARHDFEKSLLEKLTEIKDQSVVAYSDLGKEFLKSKMGENKYEVLLGKFRDDEYIKPYMNDEHFETSLNNTLSVENLIWASELVDKGNEARKEKSEAALKISYRFMLLSALSAAFGAFTLKQIVLYGIKEGLLGEREKEIQESFSIGYIDPSADWFDKEKEIYDQALESRTGGGITYPGLDRMKPEEVEQSYPDLYADISHYLNIIDRHNVETGFGCYCHEASGFVIHSQVFFRHNSGEPATTPQEFRNDLMSYVSGIEGRIYATPEEYRMQDDNRIKALINLNNAKKKLSDLTGESDPQRTRQRPKPTSLKKLIPAKKAFTATWKKQTTGTTGYQIQYSLKKNFKKGTSTKKLTIKKNTKTKVKIKGLKRRKKYYVRIRTLRKTSLGTAYSEWSKKKTVKTK